MVALKSGWSSRAAVMERLAAFEHFLRRVKTRPHERDSDDDDHHHHHYHAQADKMLYEMIGVVCPAIGDGSAQ